jgi:hypothetical protein
VDINGLIELTAKMGQSQIDVQNVKKQNWNRKEDDIS